MTKERIESRAGFLRVPPRMRFMLKPMNMSDDAFGPLRDSTDIKADGPALAARMEEEGYIYIPQLIDPDLIWAARLDMARHLASRDCIDTSKPLIDAIPARKFEAQQFFVDFDQTLPAVRKVLYDPQGAVMQFYDRMLGRKPRHLDYTWYRTQLPQLEGIPPHADVVYMGRGTHNLYTAWIPMGDAPFEMGGLAILENSRLAREQMRDYYSIDVDSYCVNEKRLPDKHDALEARKRFGFLTHDTEGLRKQIGTRWLTADYRAGDFLTFHVPTTIHGVTDNQSDRYLLSTDSRYQPADEPADERWIGSPPPGHGGKMVKGMVC